MSNDSSADASARTTEPGGSVFLERYGISPVLFALVSLLIVFILYQIVGGIITALAFGINLSPEDANGLRVATMLGQVLFILVPTLLLARLATTDRVSFLRLHRPPWVHFLIPLVGIFSLQQMLQVYMIAQESIPLPDSLRDVVVRFKELIEHMYKLLIDSSSVSELLFVIVVVALVPAVAEEMLFRGMIQRSLEKGVGTMPGILLTAAIFALYHLNPFSLIPIVVLGLYLGFLAYRSNSLWVSMAAHFYFNGITCVAVYLGMDDDYVVTGNPEALSAGELVTTFMVFSVVFFLSTYYYVRVTRPSALTIS